MPVPLRSGCLASSSSQLLHMLVTMAKLSFSNSKLVLLILIALIIFVSFGNYWLYAIFLNQMGEGGQQYVGVSVVDAAAYASGTTTSVIDDNSVNKSVTARLKALMQFRNITDKLLYECNSTNNDCGTQFLNQLTDIDLLRNRFAYRATVTDDAITKLDCVNEKLSLYCPYYLYMLSLAMQNDTQFKEFGFLSLVSEISEGDYIESYADESDLEQINNDKLTLDKCNDPRKSLTMLLATKAHCLLLILIIGVWLLLMHVRSLCCLRQFGFIQQLHRNGLSPFASWAANLLFGLIPIVLICLIAGLTYQSQCKISVTPSTITFIVINMFISCANLLAIATIISLISEKFTTAAPVNLCCVGLICVLAVVIDTDQVATNTAARLIAILLSVFIPTINLPGSAANMAADSSVTDEVRNYYWSLLITGAIFTVILYFICLYYEYVLMVPAGINDNKCCSCRLVQPLMKLCSGSNNNNNGNNGVKKIVNENDTVSGDHIEPAAEKWKLSLQLRNLTKRFNSQVNDETSNSVNNGCCCCKASDDDNAVLALTEFSADIYNNQITALIGHNGAGKSTLIKLITGEDVADDGTISFINDNNIINNNNNNRISVCHQDNRLCRELSVIDTITLISVSRGKSIDSCRDEVDRLVDRLGLDKKLDVAAGEMSGGQQRKLCCLCALLHAPSIVLLDEPSAGLDPVSRRDLWNVLSELRTTHCVLLCTQLMDEADMLADRKLLMEAGKLRCCGSSLFLKEYFKCGAVIQLECDNGDKAYYDDKIVNYLKNIYSAEFRNQSINNNRIQVECRVPSERLTGAINYLEECQKENNNNNLVFNLGITGLDEVFHRMEIDNAENIASAAAAAAVADDDNVNGVNDREKDTDQTNEVEINNQSMHKLWIQLSTSILRLTRQRLRLCMRMIIPLLLLIAFIALAVVMNNKDKDEQIKLINIANKFELTRAHYQRYDSAVCISDSSAVRAGSNATEAGCDTALLRNKLSFVKKILLLVKPDNMLLVNYLNNDLVRNQIMSTCSYAAVCPIAYANNWDISNSSTNNNNNNNNRTIYIGLFIGSKEMTQSVENTLVLAQLFAEYFSSKPIISTQIAINDKAYSGKNNHISINASNSYYYVKFQYVTFIDVPLMVLVFIFCIQTTTFLSDPIEDKVNGVAQQLITCGVSQLNYWISYAVLHWLQLIVIFIPACIILLFMTQQWRLLMPIYYILLAIIPFIIMGLQHTLWCVYGLANRLTGASAGVLAIIFIISVCIGACSMFLLMGGWLVLICCLLLPQFLSVATLLLPDKLGNYINEISEQLAIDVDNRLMMKYYLGNFQFHSIIFCYLIQIFIVFCLLGGANWCLNLFDQFYGGIRRRMRRGRVSKEEEEEEEERKMLKDNALRMRDDIETGGANVNDDSGSTPIILQSISKRYSNGCQAVQDLSLRVKRGEVFGLVGPNGAGKSTTMSIIVGTHTPTSGRRIVTENIGYCPQTDPLMPELTVSEHLKFYAATGRKQSTQAEINKLISRLRLTEHKNQLAANLSGGCRRRLSLAVGLLSQPHALIVDEPSTGVDPLCRKWVMDELRQAAKAGAAVIVSSHSMEEIESVCSRIGIVACGRFVAEGSCYQLKAIYGEHYTLDIQLTNKTSALETLSKNLSAKFPVKVNIAENFQLWARLYVALPADNSVSIAKVLQWVEQQQEQRSSAAAACDSAVAADAADFSTGVGASLIQSFAFYQASLDQIFVSLIRRADDCNQSNNKELELNETKETEMKDASPKIPLLELLEPGNAAAANVPSNDADTSIVNNDGIKDSNNGNNDGKSDNKVEDNDNKDEVNDKNDNVKDKSLREE